MTDVIQGKRNEYRTDKILNFLSEVGQSRLAEEKKFQSKILKIKV